MADADTIAAATGVSARVHCKVVDLPVRSVTVYSDRAQVVRGIHRPEIASARVDDQIEIVIDGITQYADAASIQVESTPGVTVLDVSTRNRYVKEKESDADDSAEVNQLDIRIRKLEDRKTELENTRNRLNRDSALLNQFKANFSHASVADSVLNADGVQSFLKFADYYSTTSLNYAKELKSLEESLQEVNAELSTLQTRRGELGPHRSSRGRETIEITVLVQKGASMDKKDDDLSDTDQLELSYLVQNASWTPRYDVRVHLASVKKPILNLHYQAEIRQSTGEDWADVPTLILSTAKPSLGGSAPEWTSPWVVNIRPKYVPPPPPQAKAKKMGFGGGLMRASSNAAAPMPVQMQMLAAPAPIARAAMVQDAFGGAAFECAEEQRQERGQALDDLFSGAGALVSSATASQGVAGMSFTVQQSSTDIPSDNASHRVTKLSFDPEFRYATSPKFSEQVFMKARVRNTSEYALLAGPANVFLDNSFVTRSNISDASPMELFDCPLGVDSSIRVKYPAASRQTETSGLISRSNIVRVRQDIKIRNGRQIPIAVQIRDQVPVTEDARLKVALVQASSAKKIEKKEGVTEELNAWREATGKNEPRWWVDKGWLEWVVNIDPNTEEKVGFGYDVTYPVGEFISGL